MADDSLKDPVVVRAIGINGSSLPRGLNPAYEQYILSQVVDFTNVAGKANEAGEGAYDAQVQNDQQDVELEDHELRISQLRIEVDDHEIRITANSLAITSIDLRLTTAEGNIASLQADLSALTTRVDAAEIDIDNIQLDYISKTATALQSLASPLNVTTSYSVSGTKVIGARQTGWTTGTGTPLLGAFNANQAYTVSATYTQSEVSAIATGVQQARQRILALESALRTHGLIN